MIVLPGKRPRRPLREGHRPGYYECCPLSETGDGMLQHYCIAPAPPPGLEQESLWWQLAPWVPQPASPPEQCDTIGHLEHSLELIYAPSRLASLKRHYNNRISQRNVVHRYRSLSHNNSDNTGTVESVKSRGREAHRPWKAWIRLAWKSPWFHLVSSKHWMLLHIFFPQGNSHPTTSSLW